MMNLAIQAAQSVRCITSPNPWVGCVIISKVGEIFTGATYEDGINHAEIVALNKAGTKAKGATAYVTLEPCCHQGKTPPCVDAIAGAGIEKVVVGIIDPDKKVSGSGIERLKNSGVEVEVGVESEAIKIQLAPYIKQRTTGAPYIVIKSALTLDGNIADAKGNSKWITGEQARMDAHRLRAESDVIVVGANTVRLDNPNLTVRNWQSAINPKSKNLDPKRIVLGNVKQDACVNPCESFSGSVKDLVESLSNLDVLQILVEGGSNVARQFHESGLVDKYVFYVSPSILGGVGKNLFGESANAEFEDIWRGEFESVTRLGSDIRLDLVGNAK